MVIPPPLQNVLADAWVVPLSELGQSEQQFHTRTHLGHLLHDGDTAWGFHFTRANINDPNLDKMKPADIPDVVSKIGIATTPGPLLVYYLRGGNPGKHSVVRTVLCTVL